MCARICIAVAMNFLDDWVTDLVSEWDAYFTDPKREGEDKTAIH